MPKDRATKTKNGQGLAADAESLAYAEAILRTSPVPLVVLEDDLKVVTANEAFYLKFEVEPSETEGRMIYELGNNQWDIPDLRTLLEDILPHFTWFEKFEVTHNFEHIGRRTMLLNARRLEVLDGGAERIVLVIDDITARELADRIVRESEKQLHVIADAMPALISHIDKDYRYLFANHTYYDWFGRTANEVIGKTMAEVLGKDAFKKLGPHVDKALAGHTEVFETEAPYREGGTRFVHATYLPDFDANGEVQGIFALVLDITERRHAEKAMAHASAMIDSSDDAIISKDLNGIITSWNGGAQRVFGYTADEVIGKPVLILIPDKNLNEEPKILARIRRGESIEHYETIRQRKDGSLVDISLTVSPIRDSSGKIIGASKIARDITVRKLVEAKLRSSEERFRSVLSSSNAGIVQTDATGRMVLVNQHWCEMLGYSEAELLELNVVDVTHESSVPSTLQRVGELAAGGEDFEVEKNYQRKDGSMMPAVSNVSALRSEEGEFQGLVAVVIDITERLRAEEELRRAKDDLEARVSERTHELANANTALEAEMTQRVAAEAQRVGLLRKIVTVQEEERMRISRDLHDQFGQGVTALRYHLASLAGESGNDPKIDKVLEIASQLDADVNTLVWQLRPTALDDLGLEGALRNLVAQSAKRFDVDLQFEAVRFEKLDMPAEAMTAFYRIAQEALNNIHKHAKATRASVILGQTPSAIRLVISDNGCGMTEKVQQSTRRGVGLSSMRERADLVGGTIEVESSRGNGTTIFVTLPVTDPNEKRNSSRARRRSRNG